MLRPPGNLRWGTTLSDLAYALVVRYRRMHVSDDLNEAINLFRESLWLLQPGCLPEYRRAPKLSSALCSRFTQTRMNKDIEEAIHLCIQFLEALSLQHPERCLSYMQLQAAYLSRYQILHNAADLSLAVKNPGLASRYPTQGFPQRILATLNSVVTAEDYCHESALEAYAIAKLPLPVDAALCTIRRKNLPKAVESVEQGCAQQWSLASRLRTSLEDLDSTNFNIAHKLSELSKRMSDARGSIVDADRATTDRVAIQYRRLSDQWDVVVTEIHNLQGFSRLLLSPRTRNCKRQHARAQGAHHVAFPRLALANLEKLKDDFTKEIRHTSFMGPTEPRTELVLQRDLILQCRSRIWLCQTAAFTSFSIHAAHPSRMKTGGRGRERCLEDIYNCSYTPTFSVLIRVRQTMKTRAAPTSVAIGQSQPGAGQGTVLATVDSELELVHKLVPPNVKFTNISGDEATQAGALDCDATPGSTSLVMENRTTSSLTIHVSP
ncbi:hypothetical protein EDB19DRAFT_2041766 [Suillus lakei]|nr:hypothetical protein EDB19DRAFT_2041766 [Suillus lakei]